MSPAACGCPAGSLAQSPAPCLSALSQNTADVHSAPYGDSRLLPLPCHGPTRAWCQPAGMFGVLDLDSSRQGNTHPAVNMSVLSLKEKTGTLQEQIIIILRNTHRIVQRLIFSSNVESENSHILSLWARKVLTCTHNSVIVLILFCV